MFNYLFGIWVFNFAYDNVLRTYEAYNFERPYEAASDLVDKFLWREDQLRDKCNLSDYKIPDKLSTLNSFVYTLYEYVPDINPYSIASIVNMIPVYDLPQLYLMEQLNVSSMDDFMMESYHPHNLNRKIIFNGVSYTLTTVGENNQGTVCEYTTSYPCTSFVNPEWILSLNGISHTITTMK
jgi:hypothetical protein